MSAFVVSKEHIDLLVKVAREGPRGVVFNVYTGTWDLRWYAVDPASVSSLEELSGMSRDARHEDPSSVGAMLVAENVASIRHRYPDTIEHPEHTPGPIDHYWEGEPGYVWQDPGYGLTVAEALSALDCYEYQSCEHEGWESSEAYRFVETLRGALIRWVPGYSDAPWEWTAAALENRKAGAR